MLAALFPPLKLFHLLRNSSFGGDSDKKGDQAAAQTNSEPRKFVSQPSSSLQKPGQTPELGRPKQS